MQVSQTPQPSAPDLVHKCLVLQLSCIALRSGNVVKQCGNGAPSAFWWGAGEAAAETPPTARLLQQFLELLPAISGCCADCGNMALAVQAYELVRVHLPPDEAQYAEVNPPTSSFVHRRWAFALNCWRRHLQKNLERFWIVWCAGARLPSYVVHRVVFS